MSDKLENQPEVRNESDENQLSSTNQAPQPTQKTYIINKRKSKKSRVIDVKKESVFR